MAKENNTDRVIGLERIQEPPRKFSETMTKLCLILCELINTEFQQMTKIKPRINKLKCRY